MSIVHEKIRLSKDMIGIEAHELFTNLSSELIKNYYVGVNIDLIVNGEECLIRSDKAVPLCLVLNEIITNSLKFAFEGRQSGEINIDYSCNDGKFTMTISDNGKGIPEASIRGEIDSIGLNLIYNVVSLQLHGNTEVRSESGTKWLISFPIDEN
jgi:two-component sensor histidine kinase